MLIVDTVNDIVKRKNKRNTYHQEEGTLALATKDRLEKPESTIALIDKSIKKVRKLPKCVCDISSYSPD